MASCKYMAEGLDQIVFIATKNRIEQKKLRNGPWPKL